METLSLDRLGDEIAELSAHLDAASARLLDLIREFDTREGWNTGFRCCAAWLSWRVGLDLGAARERVRVARALGTLPLLAQALARGELSYAKVRALTRVATPETEERLLAVARAGTADHVERIVRGWRRMDRKAEATETTRRHTSRALHVYQDEDGMVVVRGRLTPEVGAVLVQALTAAREALYQRVREKDAQSGVEDVSAETSTMTQQQADALALLAETALHHGIDPGTPGERYQVVVHVDAPVLADPDASGESVLEDGTHVSAETSRRLACDASRVVMRHDADGHVVEVAARTRTIPPALRRALHHRDRGCRFPGCGRRFTQGHHIRHWAQGGPTTLSNLALLCRRHHRAVHEEGYQLDRQPDGELRFRRPDGRVLPEVPRAPAVPDDPVRSLRARHEAEGLVLHAQTAMSGWLGERLDVGYAIDVLHPLRSVPPAAASSIRNESGPASRSGAARSRRAAEQALSTQVFIDIWPMDAESPSGYTPVSALLGGRRQEAGIPDEWH
jgi:5-methylcytosine-specific restriction endonuclease McrA